MKLVRGILLGLVMCLAVTGTPAQAATPAAPEAAQSAQVKKGWTVLKSWKQGALRTCRGTWDGDSFVLKFQMVNRAEQGRRGAVLGVRSEEFPEWQSVPVEPIAAGTKQTFLQADVTERPGKVKLRGKVTKGGSKSAWGKVVRGDKVKIC